MTPELFDLLLITVATALMWVPYITDAMLVRGTWSVLDNPQERPPPLHNWAVRAKAAHRNAIENLPLFAVVVLTAHAAEVSTTATVMAAHGYVAARMTHWMLYTAGIPVLRTLSFLLAWAATLTIAGVVLMG